jgi:hypothetical protein
MTLSFFEQPQVIQSASLERPKDGVQSAELDQRRIDDRKSLEAAVSEGWPVPQSSDELPMRGRSGRLGPGRKPGCGEGPTKFSRDGDPRR